MARPRHQKARRGSGSIARRVRKHCDGTSYVFYEGRIDLGFSPDGKRIQKSITGSTREEVEYKLKQLSLDAKAGKLVNRNDITVEELVKSWIDKGVRQTQSTLSTYRNQLKWYIEPHIGKIKVQKLAENDIRTWIKKLQDPEYSITRPLSDKSVKDVYCLLSTVLSDAVLDGIISVNPCSRVKIRMPAKIRKNRFLSEEEIKQLLIAMRGTKYELFFKFSLFFGLREMENLGLTLSDIDIEHRIIHLQYQQRKNLKETVLPGETLHFKRLKDHEARDLYFAREIEDLLKKQIEDELQKKKRLGSEWPSQELERGDLLFSNDKGGYLSYRTVYDAFKRICRSVGIEATIHDLRHAYAMLAIENGTSVKIVADHLGHSTPDFTFAIYDYVTNEAQRRDAETMSNVMAHFSLLTEENDLEDEPDES